MLSAQNLAEVLITNEHLERLFIYSANTLDNGIQHLAHALRDNKGLRGLNQIFYRLTSQSVKSLAEALATNTQLEALDISYNNNLSYDGIKYIIINALRVNQGLKKLNLTAYHLTSQSIEYLATGLKNNYIRLEKLNICRNALHIEDSEHLAHALSANQGLKILNMISCTLNSLSVMSLAGALKTNTHLEELNISYNSLGDNGT